MEQTRCQLCLSSENLMQLSLFSSTLLEGTRLAKVVITVCEACKRAIDHNYFAGRLEKSP